MKKTVLLFFFISLLVSACTYEKGEVPRPIEGCVNDSTVDVIEVTIGDDFFNPASIEIAVGDTVKWTYVTGASLHTSTSTVLPAGGGTQWDSGNLNPGDGFKKAITIPGNYTYICTVHGSSMKGTIVVRQRCQ